MVRTQLDQELEKIQIHLEVVLDEVKALRKKTE